jgi:hypothetical protein
MTSLEGVLQLAVKTAELGGALSGRLVSDQASAR